MKLLIKHLKEHLPYEVLSCCCGHRKYNQSIVVKDTGAFGEVIWDLISGTMITRKKRFYKKDKQGYYYIPETLEVEERCGLN